MKAAADARAQSAFMDWVRQLVKGASELQALESGQVDAIMDPATCSAILLPQARSAAHARASRRNARASRIAAVARTGAANQLLAGLPAREYAQLLPGLEPVTLACGDVLHEPGVAILHIYFPISSLVSLLMVVDGRESLEVGLVGREGVIGARVALGAATAPVRALVRGSGTALRIKSARFLKALRGSPALQRALLRSTDALMNQISQTAACNHFHVVQARLVRWLLMTRDRLVSNEFRLTQEFLADLLGVRRVSVTTAASALQRQKLIRYKRGNITILDERGLEAACCSCYRHLQLIALADAG